MQKGFSFFLFCPRFGLIFHLYQASRKSKIKKKAVNEMKNAKKRDTVLIFSAGALLLWGAFSLLLFPAPHLSERENRLLAECPRFSVAGFFDGSFTSNAERYAAERVAGRHLMRNIHAKCELLLGKCETDKVLLCRDGSLAKQAQTNERLYQKNLSAIQGLQKTARRIAALPLTVAIAPRRIEARKDALPHLFMPDESDRRTLEQYVPDAKFLTITQDREWYRTDHHWSTAGAYAAYVALGASLGFTPYAEQEFEKETVHTGFRGTSDAAAGLSDTLPDRIELWRYEGDEAFRLKKDGKDAPFQGFYDADKLNTRDGYAVFLGGNDGICEITEGENDTRPTLLLIKDSFANSVIPFLARHYRILAVDPRYTKADLSPFFAKADQALLLMGLQTLAELTVF